jgi:hypothetical protein
MRRILVLSLCLVAATACASSPPKVQRSEFEDIPVPKGLIVDLNKSTIIESPEVKAARLFYKGRVEIESVAVAVPDDAGGQWLEEYLRHHALGSGYHPDLREAQQLAPGAYLRELVQHLGRDVGHARRVSERPVKVACPGGRAGAQLFLTPAAPPGRAARGPEAACP